MKKNEKVPKWKYWKYTTIQISSTMWGNILRGSATGSLYIESAKNMSFLALFGSSITRRAVAHTSIPHIAAHLATTQYHVPRVALRVALLHAHASTASLSSSCPISYVLCRPINIVCLCVLFCFCFLFSSQLLDSCERTLETYSSTPVRRVSTL